MFSLKNAKPIQEPFPVAPNVAGVELDKVEFVEVDGNQYLDFYYRIGDKYSLRDRRFPVKKDNLKMMQRDGESLAQTEERLIAEAGRVYFHIASKFCTDTEINEIAGETFKEFCGAYCALVNTNCKGVKLYMKTVLNKGGYVSVPKAGRFLQNESDGVCTLSYTAKELQLIDAATKRNEGISVEATDDSV